MHIGASCRYCFDPVKWQATEVAFVLSGCFHWLPWEHNEWAINWATGRACAGSSGYSVQRHSVALVPLASIFHLCFFTPDRISLHWFPCCFFTPVWINKNDTNAHQGKLVGKTTLSIQNFLFDKINVSYTSGCRIRVFFSFLPLLPLWQALIIEKCIFTSNFTALLTSVYNYGYS